LNSNKNSIGKHSADDEDKEYARSCKHRRGEDDEPPRTPEDKIRTVTLEEEESSTKGKMDMSLGHKRSYDEELPSTS